jgi:hypothetical protein
MSQVVILCEGYDDRSFWAGWLDALGCVDARRGGSAVDPWSEPVRGGQYAYRTPSGRFVRLHPCDGRQKLAAIAALYLSRSEARPVSTLVLSFDADVDAPEVGRADALIQAIAARRKVTISSEEGATQIEGVPALSVMWSCDDPPAQPGVPGKQTLERLVAASIAAAYEPRSSSVGAWLAAEPPTIGASHKAHAYAYLAKWYGEHGCADFLSGLWRDATVRAQLEARLRRSGAWSAIHDLVTA